MKNESIKSNKKKRPEQKETNNKTGKNWEFFRFLIAAIVRIIEAFRK